LFLSLLVVSIVGCSRSGRPGPKPQELAELAQKFRAKAGHDRFAEGEKIQTLLPDCPITWEKDIGTGTLVAFDYTHPSYKLTKPDLFRALGQPDSSYNDTVWYVLVHDSNDMLWQISVDFHDDYVVGSTITGSPKKDR
jgi:hypothetical protein